MRPWFVVSTLAFAGVHAQQSVVSNIPSSCSTPCTVLGSLASTDPATLCTEGVRSNLQRCLDCITTIGGNAITPNLVTSGQMAANAFTSACGSASFKVDSILVHSAAHPTPTVWSGPTPPSGNKNGASPMAACGVSGLAFVWGVSMLLI